MKIPASSGRIRRIIDVRKAISVARSDHIEIGGREFRVGRHEGGRGEQIVREG